MKNIISLHPGSRSAGEGISRPAPGDRAKVIAITSGKGGVGKTNITSNLAIALAQEGARVCVFDADTGLANVNIVMGVAPVYSIADLLDGARTLDQILVRTPDGVTVVPAASGIAEYVHLGPTQQARLKRALEELETRFDYLLIDTGAGIGEDVLNFVRAAQFAVLVITPEPTSLTDAFAMIRVLKRAGYEKDFYVLVNLARNYAASIEIFKRFEAAVKKYLKAKVRYLGYISDDDHVKIAVALQRPVLLQTPHSHASRCFKTLATVVGKQFKSTESPERFAAYWQNMAQPDHEGGRRKSVSAGGIEAETADDKGEGAHDQRIGELLNSIRQSVDGRVFADTLINAILDLYEEKFADQPTLSKERLQQLAGKLDLKLTTATELVDTLAQQEILRTFDHVAKRLAEQEDTLRRSLTKMCAFIDATDHEWDTDEKSPGNPRGSSTSETA